MLGLKDVFLARTFDKNKRRKELVELAKEYFEKIDNIKIIAAIVGGTVGTNGPIHPFTDIDLLLITNKPFRKKYTTYKGINIEINYCNKKETEKEWIKTGEEGWRDTLQGLVLKNKKLFQQWQKLMPKWKKFKLDDEQLRDMYLTAAGKLMVNQPENALYILRYLADEILRTKLNQVLRYKLVFDQIKTIKDKTFIKIYKDIFAAKPTRKEVAKLIIIVGKYLERHHARY